MDTTLKLETSWSETKEKIKEVVPHLTDQDLVYTPGQEDELLERLSILMKRTREEVKSWIESVSYNRGKAS